MSILPMYKTKSSNMGLPNGPEARKSLALYGLTKGSMRRLYTSAVWWRAKNVVDRFVNQRKATRVCLNYFGLMCTSW